MPVRRLRESWVIAAFWLLQCSAGCCDIPGSKAFAAAAFVFASAARARLSLRMRRSSATWLGPLFEAMTLLFAEDWVQEQAETATDG